MISWARCRKAFCYISNKRQTGTGLAVSFFQIFWALKKRPVQVDHMKKRSTNKTSPKIGGFLVKNFHPKFVETWSDLAFRPSRADPDNDTKKQQRAEKMTKISWLKTPQRQRNTPKGFLEIDRNSSFFEATKTTWQPLGKTLLSLLNF